MNDKHITGILENNKLKDLNAEQLAAVESHARACAECRRAFQAAKISLLMVKKRAADSLEPTPFFEAKVMNAIREQRKSGAQTVGNRFWQMWQAAKILVSSLAAAVVLLGVLTFSVAQTGEQTDFLASADTEFYTAESVLFGQADSGDELNNDEVFHQFYDYAEGENDYEQY